MFLKGSLGGHHVLARVAIGIFIGVVLALIALLVAGLARGAWP